MPPKRAGAARRSSNSNASTSVAQASAAPSRPTPLQPAETTQAQLGNAYALLATFFLSLTTYASSTALAPLFGAAAASEHVNKVLAAALVLSVFGPTPTFKYGCASVGMLLSAGPTLLYQLGITMGKKGDPVYGSTSCYAAVLAPIIYLTVGVMDKVSAAPIVEGSSSFSIVQNIVYRVGVYVGVTNTKSMWSALLPPGTTFNSNTILIAMGWIPVFISAFPISDTPGQRPPSTSRWHKRIIVPLLAALLATSLSLSLRPIHTPATPYTILLPTNSTTPGTSSDTPTLRIFSSTPSITGQIVVGESSEQSFRYLRADHSLLGGVWIGKNVARMDGGQAVDSNGTELGDSIYSAFVLQEAARFHVSEKKQESALIIGLGVGIAAQSFISHGLSTTIVEIDPAVYTAARTYFGLSEPSSVYLEDARGWVLSRALNITDGASPQGTTNAKGKGKGQNEWEKFDIVVHDCFSGGGVPGHLFTMEFWTDLKKIMSPEGIVAVNFAGRIGGDPAKAILSTLQKSFGACRAFHDTRTDRTAEELRGEFMNIVFFCSPSSGPISFRVDDPKDYHRSYLREHVLSSLPQREVDLAMILGPTVVTGKEKDYILTDEKNPLNAWQASSAVEHWKLMRGVLPDVFWETY
ncbi:S-adenosyl-L-methionine-dependent methyltransferase [Rickenella mellea]|uniref:S-adenosyl-L-methionine-dependent methyltransferase n=1 Tax=Rickenella mellea TaxID=50990 RepID=A0A4Y7PLW9_9AGAM|nr:S-adenosyl-L-methionine-dependent methyltransferase [Rickenella mellea]